MPGALPSFRRGLSGALFGVLSDQDSQRGLQELCHRERSQSLLLTLTSLLHREVVVTERVREQGPASLVPFLGSSSSHSFPQANKSQGRSMS